MFQLLVAQVLEFGLDIPFLSYVHAEMLTNMLEAPETEWTQHF